MSATIRLRRDTAANWTSANPILALGEAGYETDTHILRIGDGATHFTSLTALTPGSGSINTFSTIQVSGQSDVVADSSTDTLTLVAGTGVTITTNAGTDTITIAASGGSGTVTHTGGALTANRVVIGAGSDDLAVLSSLGTTTTVLHGNAAGAPTYGAVDLTADVTGDLPFSSLAQGAALSVLGVTGNATADHASIAAASDKQVLRRSGTAVAFGAVDLTSSSAVSGVLPIANIATGTPDGTKFVRDDGTLAVPSGTGGGITALTGDVTASGTGSVSATLANIPDNVPVAGKLLVTAIAAPTTPGAGNGRVYVDSTSKNLAVKDDAGVVKHGVRTLASSAGQFVTAIDDDGTVHTSAATGSGGAADPIFSLGCAIGF